MNIRVDLNTPITDGTEVVFRSPVDCSQITGLIVYYNGESKEFAFADAHGNNVGDIDHLFAENVVVKVILDVTTSMAFVQNADTNAYLEWRFQDTIDKLCPSFRESGAVVQCEPVEGYPLKVTTELPASEGISEITLFHSGKNLYDRKSYPLDIKSEKGKYYHYTYADGKRIESNSYCSNTTLIPVGHLKGKKITLNHAPADNASWSAVGMCFYTGSTGDTFISGAGGNGRTYVVPDNAEYMGFSVPREFADGTQIQIELGDAVTEYEPYRGQKTFTKKFTEPVYGGNHNWDSIPAMAGTNVLFSSVGTTVVEGKADPVALIDKLTNAIISLGGNV